MTDLLCGVSYEDLMSFFIGKKLSKIINDDDILESEILSPRSVSSLTSAVSFPSVEKSVNDLYVSSSSETNREMNCFELDSASILFNPSVEKDNTTVMKVMKVMTVMRKNIDLTIEKDTKLEDIKEEDSCSNVGEVGDLDDIGDDDDINASGKGANETDTDTAASVSNVSSVSVVSNVNDVSSVSAGNNLFNLIDVKTIKELFFEDLSDTDADADTDNISEISFHSDRDVSIAEVTEKIFTKRKESVAILDLDDTIFPTTYLWTTNRSILVKDAREISTLVDLCSYVTTLIKKLSEDHDCYLVTNANHSHSDSIKDIYLPILENINIINIDCLRSVCKSGCNPSYSCINCEFISNEEKSRRIVKSRVLGKSICFQSLIENYKTGKSLFIGEGVEYQAVQNAVQNINDERDFSRGILDVSTVIFNKVRDINEMCKDMHVLNLSLDDILAKPNTHINFY